MRRLMIWLVALCVSVAAEARKPVIFLIGDSTMATKDLGGGNPERGWGQMFPNFLDDTFVVENHARNGRSTKSFVDEGRWAGVESRMQSGDWLFIEFGHNDEKSEDPARYSSPERYGENLRGFVRAARARGVTPVLLTPVVRRRFEGGELKGGHGEYGEAVRRVAAEEGAVLIDAERLTFDTVSKLGDEASKSLYMWVEKDRCILHPEGRQDDTHFVARGARMVARMVAKEIERLIPQLAPHVRYYDFVVAQDGSGDFFTVQEAVNAVPDFAQSRENTIYICNGTYRERVNIPSSKRNLHMIGQSAEGVVITSGCYAGMVSPTGEPYGTSGSATVYAGAHGFTADDMTFENSAGRVGQAVAVMTLGDKQAFRRCRFLGNQDTIYTYGKGNREGEAYEDNYRNYFVDCYIEGTTDFIFGSATALFERCRIHSKHDSYVTASSSYAGQPYGYVFIDCELTADEGVTKCYLGRPWRNYAQTVFIGCRLGGHIRPEGWHNWKKPEAESTTFYGEYGSTGEGAADKGRVRWARRISRSEAEGRFSRESVVAGRDGWYPFEM